LYSIRRARAQEPHASASESWLNTNARVVLFEDANVREPDARLDGSSSYGLEVGPRPSSIAVVVKIADSSHRTD